MSKGRKKLNHEDVESRLDGTGIHWVGRYTGSTIKTEFGCDACGHHWFVLPGSIFTAGSGCPSCFSKAKRGRYSRIRIEGFGIKANPVIENLGSCLILDISTPSASGARMIVDWVDYERLKKADCGRIGISNYGYAIGRIEGKRTLIHRFIMNFPKEVDHVNQDKLDNRRENLREVEAWQNQANRPDRNLKTETGVAGVTMTRHGRFKARLLVRGKRVLEKNFKTLHEASEARRKAMLEHLGEFAPEHIRKTVLLTD